MRGSAVRLGRQLLRQYNKAPCSLALPARSGFTSTLQPNLGHNIGMSQTSSYKSQFTFNRTLHTCQKMLAKGPIDNNKEESPKSVADLESEHSAEVPRYLEKRHERQNTFLELFRKYGRTAVAFYFFLDGVSLMGLSLLTCAGVTLVMLYFAVDAGIDVSDISKRTLGFDLETYVPEEAGVFLLAYSLNHVSTTLERAVLL